MDKVRETTGDAGTTSQLVRDDAVHAAKTQAPDEMTGFSRFISYVYFIRFGLILWVSMPALAGLDAWAGGTFTRGIIALGNRCHLFFAAFFCVLNGWIALLTSRIVCAYGKDRFGFAPPGWMQVGLGRMSAAAFWGAQVPGLILSDPALEKMRQVAGCSDLQAVAWGLAYADFMRLLFPNRLWPGRFDEYDRGWALQQAFWRNRLNGCDPGRMDQSVPPEEDSLSDLMRPRVPAFSFNTTVAETGDRFLLANYAIPKQNEANAEIIPASSFLEVYGIDLPFSSAARMSANFPYVSPMAKVPIKDSHFHFGDGGYFDNDGTATALEYLWYAFHPAAGSGKVATAAERRIPVLIVEIRDGDDLRSNEQCDDLAHQTQKDDWGLTGQTTGPLTTFYQAGHSSVRVRNRRELCFLEQALADRAWISHVVFEYAKDPGDIQPLSWHLTAKQLCDIAGRLDKVKEKARWATEWFSKALKIQAEEPPSCIHD